MTSECHLHSSHQQSETSSATPGEFLFVDPAVPDIATIFATLRPGVKAALLDAARPAAAMERLARANPSTMQRAQEVTRERKAMARLVELATADGRSSGAKSSKRKEKTAERAETSDTEESREAQAAATPVAEEDAGTS